MGIVALLYGIIAYFVFFASFLYLVVFVGGDMIPYIDVPKTIDVGPSPLAGWPPALVNVGLLLAFGIQHTVMARQGFKKVWTRIVPRTIERSTYVIVTSLLLFLIYHLWIPMEGTVWAATGIWATVMTVLFYLGFAIVFVSTFLINHFDLFGLHQVWSRYRRTEMPSVKFVTPLFYKWVRHPLYLGFMIAFWAVPVMSVGHLFFAAIMTIYMFIAMGYEERDLTEFHGEEYRVYVTRVPMIFPFGKRD